MTAPCPNCEALRARIAEWEAYALSVYVHEAGCALDDDKECDCILSTLTDKTMP